MVNRLTVRSAVGINLQAMYTEKYIRNLREINEVKKNTWEFLV
jgi:hypothetical protein